MRLRILAPLLLLAAVVSMTGCRQTTGTIAGGPAPAGTLAPISPNQQPILGPFTGTTRVTPPSTGSYQPAGGYIGASTAPAGQSNLGTRRPAVVNGNNVIGSGVQVAGWTETNAVLPTAAQGNFGTNPSSANNPRSGGMHVNDLTHAPPPPGYRPGIAPPVQSFGGTSPTGVPYQSLPGPLPVSPNAMSNIVVAQGWQGQNVALPTNQAATSLQSINPPGASSLNPAPPVSQSPVSTQPPGPTTEPIRSGTAPSEAGNGDLMWRRPGSQF